MIQAGGAFEHQSLEKQYQTLFRNLQSFTSIPFGNCGQTFPEALGVDSSDRYFTLRVEFRKKCHLPQALDPNSIINRDSVPCDGENRRSIVCESMQRMEKTVLGQIVEKNCTGLGIKLSAYNEIGDETAIHQADERDELSFAPETHPLAQELTNEVRSSKRLKMEMERTERCDIPVSNSNCHAQTHDVSPQSIESVFENGARAYAIPLPPPFTRDYAEYKRSAHHLLCTIQGCRLKDNKLLQYKTYFDKKNLEKPKQWIASRNVILEDTLISNIGEQLDFVMSRYRDSDEILRYEDVLACIGKSLIVSTKLVAHFITSADIQRIYHDAHGESSTDMANSDGNDEARSAQDESGFEVMKAPIQFHYSFALNPFTVVI